jgi:ribonuclease HI
MTSIKIDLNIPEFQKDLFGLEKNELSALIKTLKKIHKLSWVKLYSDNGLKWKEISSKQTKSDQRIYRLRLSQKYRITALRQEDFLKLLEEGMVFARL